MAIAGRPYGRRGVPGSKACPWIVQFGKFHWLCMQITTYDLSLVPAYKIYLNCIQAYYLKIKSRQTSRPIFLGAQNYLNLQ